MKNYSSEQHINAGTGVDLTILELARLVAGVVGFKGEILHDLSKADGTPRKVLDISQLKTLGWMSSIGLEEGVASTYIWYRRHSS